MPVSVITDVVTWMEMIMQIGVATVELGVLTYLVFFNGWLDMIRKICFWLDTLIIQYTDKFYSYYDKLLNGKIFAPDVVDRVMNGVYVFVAVFVLFKLMMLLMKYLTNPEMVQDEKMGASSLVKRVILGMCLMLFLPTIFDLGYRAQSAILSDNVFGKLLLTDSQLSEYEANKNQMGRVLSFNVYQAFWNMDTNQVKNKKIVNKYKEAVKLYDPSSFGDINKSYNGNYAIDYFPVASTVVLLYVIYLIIKYCIDIVVRMFKLFILQMLGPLAITDYMVNGDSKDMFKSWVKTTISAYAMLFMRVFSIWFVAFVSILMGQKCTNVGSDGICKDSMLYMIEGQDPDYLLRALITLGLLAFLMDLPKLLSEIFGLDLEQDASVKGLMGKVGGAAKMLGMGAMAAGGAALGGAIGGMKNTAGALKEKGLASAQNKAKLNESIAKQDPAYAKKMGDIQNNKDLTARQKAKQMNAMQKDWLKNDKKQTKAARAEYKANKPELKAQHKAEMQAWKDAGGKNSGMAKPTMEKKPQQSAIARDYKSAQRLSNMKVGAAASSIGGGLAGGAMSAFASQIPGVGGAVNAFKQNAGGGPNFGGGKPQGDDKEEGNNDSLFGPEDNNVVGTVSDVPVTNATTDANSSDYGSHVTQSGIILDSSVPLDKK